MALTVDMSKATPLDGVTVDMAKALPIDDQSKSLYKTNPVANEETKSTQLSSPFEKAVNWFNTSLASPQQVKQGLGNAGKMDLANANAMSFGLMKPVNQEQAQQNQNNPDVKFLQGATNSVSNTASGLTSPKNIALGAVGAVNPALGLALAASPSMTGLYKNGLSEFGRSGLGGQINAGIEGIKQGEAAREAGDYEKAGEGYTSGLSNLAMSGLMAKGVGDIAKGIVAPLNPYDQAINPKVQNIASQDYPLTPADIKQTRPTQLIQKMLEKNPMTAQIWKNFGDKQRATLGNEVSDFQEGLGQSTPEETAQSIQEGISEKTKAFKDTAKELYDKVSQLAGDKTSPMLNLTASLQKILSNEKNLPEGLQMSNVMYKLNKTLGDVKPKTNIETPIGPQDIIDESGKSFDQMRKTRARYGQLIKSKDIVGTPEEGIYKQLKSAVESDIDNFAQQKGSDLLDAYHAANQFYKPGKTLLNSKLTKSLGNMAEESPGKISNVAIKPGEFKRVQDAKELLGDKFEPIQQQFAQKLISSSSVTPAGATEPVIQGGKLLANYKKYGEKVMQEVFGPDMANQLKDLGIKSNLSSSAIKASGQGGARAAGGAGGAGMFKSLLKPVIGIPGIPYSKFALSPFGRRFLTTSLPAPAIGNVALPLYRSLMKDQQGE